MAASHCRRVAAALAVVLALSGCNLSSSDGGSEVGPVTNSDSATGPGAPTTPAEIDADAIVTRTLTSMSPRYHATWPEVPGAPSLNHALADEVRARVGVFAGNAQGSDKAELNIGWQLIADAHDVLGIRLDIYEFAGAGGAESSRIWWYDVSAGVLLSNADLVADEAALAAALVASAPDDDVDPAAVRAAVADGLGHVSFSAAGGMEVTFDEYAVAPGSSGEVRIVLDAARTELLLPEAGNRVRRAAAALAVDDEGLVTPLPPEAGTQDGPSQQEEGPKKGSKKGKQGRKNKKQGKKQRAEEKRPDCRKLKCVALTFDDGPVAGTDGLLRTLKKLNAPATFFVLGQQAATYPDIVAKAHRQGHEIGVHTWNHKRLTTLKPKQITRQLQKSVAEVRRITQAEPTLMRPPYGATGPRVRNLAAQLGLAQVLWDVDTRDWARKRIRPIVKEVRRSTERGSIVLMHDIHANSVAAVPRVVKALRKQGFTLVTVSDLLGETQPGQRYHSAR